MSERHPRSIEIAAGNARAFVYPEHGFQLHGFEVEVPGHGTVPVVYGPPERGEPWDRRYGNPILFPSIVFSHGPEKNSWAYQGRELLMPQHGWARDLYWHVESIEKDSVVGWLEPTHGVAVAFPFQFRLRLAYSLQDGALVLDAAVSNRGAEAFPYALGFHPYLRAPLSEAGSRKTSEVVIPAGTRLRTRDDWRTVARSPRAAGSVALSDPELSEGFVMEDTLATSLEVIDHASRLATRVSVEGSEQRMPVWAVWAAAPDAQYVCLEPWTSEPNSLNLLGREQDLRLAPGACHRYRMSISLLSL